MTFHKEGSFTPPLPKARAPPHPETSSFQRLAVGGSVGKGARGEQRGLGKAPAMTEPRVKSVGPGRSSGCWWLSGGHRAPLCGRRQPEEPQVGQRRRPK